MDAARTGHRQRPMQAPVYHRPCHLPTFTACTGVSMAPYKRTHIEVSDEEGNPVIPVGLPTTWINLLMHHLRSRSFEHIPTSQLLES